MNSRAFPASLAILLLVLSAAAGAAKPPNIIVMISDDAGYADWEFMDDYLQSVNPGQAGSPVPTPHLNTLRDRGVLFTSAYTAPVCSPSRCAIVTGSYPQRIGYETNIGNLTAPDVIDGLPPDTPTLFHRMKALGYTTGAIGKWHLGARENSAGLGNRPENMMVDEFFGMWRGSRPYTIGEETDVTRVLRETIRSPFRDTVLETTAPWNTTDNYVSRAYAQGAIDFIDRHHADAAPFFLYIAFTAPHGPMHDSPDIDDPRIASLTGLPRQYAAMVLTMDKEIGRIFAKLDDPAGDGSVNLTADTLVFFINDNGGLIANGTANTPLRNDKGSVHEGGIRVPMVLAGPGVPANPVSPVRFDAPVHSIDILPTCIAAAGGTPPPGIDGVNLLPFLAPGHSGSPHDRITIRIRSKVSVRKGDWKLVKDTSGESFELYNLAQDIGETNDLASANPALVAELLRDFTAFEAGCDKPRNATANPNSHFTLAPLAPAPTGGNVVLNPGFENGTQSDADPRFSFAELDHWSNNGVEDGTIGAVDNDARSGTYRGMLLAATRIPTQLTGHVITGGETMSLDFWHIGKSGWQAGDTIAAELFHLDDEGAVQVLAGATFQPQVDVWQQSTHEFPALEDPSAIGKPLGIRFRSNVGDGRFASIDDIILATGSAGGVTLDWSGGNVWTDAATGAAYSLLAADSFAGTRLEFPVSGGFSYTATNNMTRMSNLEFMLNEMRLSGVFDGAAPQTATVDGNELLFTNDLSASPPAIHIAADGPDFLFRIATDLILYHDLEINGDGTAKVEITGSIRDYHDSRGVTKNGASSVLLGGTHTYSGPTTIANGGIILDDGASLANTDVLIQAGFLGGNGTIGGDVSGPGAVRPGRSTGTLSVVGNAAPGFLHVEIDGGACDRFDVAGTLDLAGTTLVVSDLGGGFTEPAYVIASYGALTGTFAAVTGLPEGYVIDYAHDDGTAANHVALVRDGYAAWISGSGVSGEDAAFTADANNDGIANGLAFFLGAPDANQNAAPFLPTGTLAGDHLVFSFDRAAAASALAYTIQYGSDLHAWSEAIDGVDSISIIVNDNGATDHVTASLPATLIPGLKMFARLVVRESLPTGK